MIHFVLVRHTTLALLPQIYRQQLDKFYAHLYTVVSMRATRTFNDTSFRRLTQLVRSFIKGVDKINPVSMKVTPKLREIKSTFFINNFPGHEKVIIPKSTEGKSSGGIFSKTYIFHVLVIWVLIILLNIFPRNIDFLLRHCQRIVHC